MRYFAIIPLLIVAACGGGSSEQNKTAAKAASLAAGQWELTSEVTAFETVDRGAPMINTPVGTRATETVCVGEGRAPAALFTGEGYACRYDNYYVRNGRMNVTTLCTREGLSGSVPMTSDGTFDESSLEYVRDVRTSLSSGGDVAITLRVTGRRTGDCTPEPAAGNESNGQAG